MSLFRVFAVILLSALWASAPVRAEEQTGEAPYENWAVGILATDWRDGNGTPIDAFENARFALRDAFASVGFRPENITDISLRPMRFGGDSLTSDVAFELFEAQARSATAGCLLYLTSHGLPEGIVLGDEGFLRPARLNRLVNEWCGTRPTVIVVSACFSGVFVPVLSAPHRMVMTASRADRSSFGCGAGSVYPYFDGCVVESLPAAEDFVHLSSLARRCVSAREKAERLTPPSEPMTHIGADVKDLLVFQNFERAGTAREEEFSSLTLP